MSFFVSICPATAAGANATEEQPEYGVPDFGPNDQLGKSNAFAIGKPKSPFPTQQNDDDLQNLVDNMEWPEFN